jgi:hypothetical protein
VIARAFAAVSPGSPLAETIGAGLAGPQFVVGRLDYEVPADAPRDGVYALIVIDRRSGRSVRFLYGTTPSGRNSVSTGWDGRFDALTDAQLWLASLKELPGVAPVSPFGFSREALSRSATTPGPLTLYAELNPNALPITTPSTDLTVVLAFFSADPDRLNWVIRLPARTVQP